MFRTAALRGVAAGMAGVAVMTVAEKVEQRLTRRPNSYVPGRTLLASSPSARLSGRSRRCGTTPCTGALGHWGTGALLGGLRGIWAATGLRGPRANLVHTVVRLATDQTFENAVGVGAPPWTWPRQEQMIDVAHKAIYSFVSRLDRRSRHHPHRSSIAGTVSH